MAHIPILIREILGLLDIRKSDTVVDGTLNGGGHSREMLNRLGREGSYVGIEWDRSILERTEQDIRSEYSGRLPETCFFTCGNYRDMKRILASKSIGTADAILLDLGFSSLQIDDPERGFSFQNDGPLDMRYNTDSGDPAYAVLNAATERELADIFYAYGEERKSRRIAKAIVEERKRNKIMRTGELREVIERVIRPHGRDRIHPATRVFQALRMYVNDELGNLRSFLADMPDILAPGGRCAILSFHSLEDRMVKQAFHAMRKEGTAEELTKKPVVPGLEEIGRNPRSRSAKLRVIRKV